MARKIAEQTRLKDIVADYRSRVEAEPALQSEFIAITRDYDTQRDLYRTLLAKKGESGISANLERQQVSQQFKTLDAARLPELPSGPNRPLLNLFAAVMGIGLGLGLTIVLELRDQSFRTGAEIAGVLAIPVLAMVPGMIGRSEMRRRNRRMAVSIGVDRPGGRCRRRVLLFQGLAVAAPPCTRLITVCASSLSTWRRIRATSS